MAKPIEEWTEAELEAFISMPAWADRLNLTHELVAGAHLPTKDGRVMGNAHIVKIEPAFWNPDITMYTILTDAGNTARMLQSEIAEWFHPSPYICDVQNVLAKFGQMLPPDDPARSA